MLSIAENICLGVASFLILRWAVLWITDHTNAARTCVARRALGAVPKAALFFFPIRGIWPSLPLSWQIGLALMGVLGGELHAAQFRRISRGEK